MSLDSFATVLNILASLSVIATLGFVALQIRHNTAAAKLSAAQMSAQLLTANLGRVVECADFADILARNDFASLTPGERLRVSNFFSASMRHFEVLNMHRLSGHYEDELWAGAEQRILQLVQGKDFCNFWADSRRYYAKTFVTFIDGLIEQHDPKLDDMGITGATNPGAPPS